MASGGLEAEDTGRAVRADVFAFQSGIGIIVIAITVALALTIAQEPDSRENGYSMLSNPKIASLHQHRPKSYEYGARSATV